MTGMSTQAAIRPALPAISVMVSRPTSGRPIRAAEVPNPVMYTAGNPASSTNRADSGSNAPGATMVWPESSRARRRAGPPGRRVSRAVTGRPWLVGTGRLGGLGGLGRLGRLGGGRVAHIRARLHSKPCGAGPARVPWTDRCHARLMRYPLKSVGNFRWVLENLPAFLRFE